MSLPKLEHAEVVYPHSDGKPMAETDVHRRIMVDTIDAVAHRHADDPEVYVSGNLLVYYVEGDPRKSVSPDFFLVRGVPKRERRTYRTWEEGKGLDVVIEISSKKSRRKDLREKPAIYETLGVEEYFLFDPLQEYLEPFLQGFQRERDKLVPMEPARSEGEALVLPSAVLGLELVGSTGQLRLRDPATGLVLPTSGEARAENARLREEIERLKRRRQ